MASTQGRTAAARASLSEPARRLVVARGLHEASAVQTVLPTSLPRASGCGVLGSYLQPNGRHPDAPLLEFAMPRRRLLVTTPAAALIVLVGGCAAKPPT